MSNKATAISSPPSKLFWLDEFATRQPVLRIQRGLYLIWPEAGCAIRHLENAESVPRRQRRENRDAPPRQLGQRLPNGGLASLR